MNLLTSAHNCVHVCVCVRTLTVDLVVGRQQPDVGQRDAARVTVVKLHRDEIVVLVHVCTSCLRSEIKVKVQLTGNASALNPGQRFRTSWSPSWLHAVTNCLSPTFFSHMFQFNSVPYRWPRCPDRGSGTVGSSRRRCGCPRGGSARTAASRRWSARGKITNFDEELGDGEKSRGEERQVEQVTHRLLQQLLQAVDVRPVASLPLHHHAVSAAAAAVTRDTTFTIEFDFSGTHLGDLWPWSSDKQAWFLTIQFIINVLMLSFFFLLLINQRIKELTLINRGLNCICEILLLRIEGRFNHAR